MLITCYICTNLLSLNVMLGISKLLDFPKRNIWQIFYILHSNSNALLSFSPVLSCSPSLFMLSSAWSKNAFLMDFILRKKQSMQWNHNTWCLGFGELSRIICSHIHTVDDIWFKEILKVPVTSYRDLAIAALGFPSWKCFAWPWRASFPGPSMRRWYDRRKKGEYVLTVSWLVDKQRYHKMSELSDRSYLDSNCYSPKYCFL